MNVGVWTRLHDGLQSKVNHQAVLYNGLMYIFGGYSYDSNSEQYDTYQITVLVWDTTYGLWTQLKQMPLLKRLVNDDVMRLHSQSSTSINSLDHAEPCERYGHTVVLWNHRAWLWGGRTDRDACPNYLYSFDLDACACSDTRSWVRIEGDAGRKPEARDGHAAAVSGNDLFVYGGYVASTELYDSDLYMLNFDTWQWTNLALHKSYIKRCPSPRDFTSMCTHDHRLFLFGGRSDRNGHHFTGREVYDPSLWEFDRPSQEWKVLHNGSTSDAPIGRRSTSFWSFRNSLYVCFGLNGVENQHLSDLWRFDLANLLWTRMHTFGQQPSPRRRAVCALDGQRSTPKVYIFGGTQPKLSANLHDISPIDEDFETDERHLSDLNECYVLDLDLSLYQLCLHKAADLPVNDEYLPQTIVNDLKQIHTPTSRKQA